MPPPQALIPTSGLNARNTQLTGETSEHQIGCESRYKEDMDMYFKRYGIYRDARKEWEYYHAVQTKLRDKIQAEVAN